ncbi:MAG TPA: universal stress protein [Parafilimonas sp.]|nr:universal stress protein [Parafilimonas sp.]
METFFSNILVPVDFSINTDVAIEKAIWLAVPGSSIVHLLHVQKRISKTRDDLIDGLSVAAFRPQVYSYEKAGTKLQQLKAKIEMSSHNLTVATHIIQDEDVQKGITCFGKQLHPSLIIIAESSSYKRFPFFKKVNISALAKQTNCPVLTVKPGSRPNRMKSVVLPVRSFVPERKIELLSALTRNQRPVVHLVSMYNDECFNGRAGAFLDAYRTLSDYLGYPVEYKTLKGGNIAKALFEYAQFIMADFIIVNPGEETKISAIYGTDVSDIVTPDSRLCVLMAEPFPSKNLRE